MRQCPREISGEDRLGIQGSGNPKAVLTQHPGKKSFRIEVYCDTPGEAADLTKKYGGSVKALKEENWAALSTASTTNLKIRDCLIVTSTAEKEARTRLAESFGGRRRVISIPPQLAFGTGEHATTSTCLRMLVDIARELGREGRADRWEFLDLGTGTGILAIAARMLGAASAEAWDFDPRAVTIAKQNAELNGTDGIMVRQRDVTNDLNPGRSAYPLVAANMFSDVLISVMPKIARLVEPGGRLIVSGILRSQEHAVIQAAEGSGFRMEKVVRRGKWVTGRGLRC